MRKNVLPDQATLLRMFHYDPDTGALTWRKTGLDKNKQYLTGKPAGWSNGRGYMKVTVDGVRYFTHRIIWKMVTGEEPTQVDHEDTDKSNNRWSNLRKAGGQSDNMANCRVRSDNRLGVKGVTQKGKRFYARIAPSGKPISLGGFDTVEEAHAAYVRAAKLHFGEFHRG